MDAINNAEAKTKELDGKLTAFPDTLKAPPWAKVVEIVDLADAEGRAYAYVAEAIEILLQVMENRRDDLVVILAAYKDRMDSFFRSNPGLNSRIAHHIDFPDYSRDELMQIAGRMLAGLRYRFDERAAEAFARYLERRVTQPHFANARSVRNALDRARLRQAGRLFSQRDHAFTPEELSTLAAEDILASRVVQQPTD